MYERLLDKSKQPSLTELELFCGENQERFQALNNDLSERFHTSQEIRFPYGKSYGWCVTHRKGKRLICDVFAERGAFTVMLRLADERYLSVYAQLKEHARNAIDHRYPCGDGGWIHYRVTCEDDLRDMMILLNTKCAS